MRSVLSIILAVGICGCALSPKDQAATNGALVGTAAGAGTGAIIGASISDGDIAMSALLGGAIGLPVGALTAYYFYNQSERDELNENQLKIERNEDEILAEEGNLAAMRERVERESRGIELDPSRFDYIYNGPTIGTYR